MTDDDFRINDLVYHLVIGDEDDEQRYVGYVTGFCPAPKWVRVRTFLLKKGTAMTGPNDTPNAETLAALKEIEEGGGKTYYGTTEEIFEQIMNEEDQPEPDNTLQRSP